MTLDTVVAQSAEFIDFDFDIEEVRRENERLCHDDDCDGKHGYKCPCGCGTTIICPGKEICRMRIIRLSGLEETKAVREWMRLGLCICSFVVKNRNNNNSFVTRLTDRQFTKANGNWTAKRRRKLVQCPCGAYFDNATVRALGLYSESEWKRRGYPKFKGGKKYYLDAETAKKLAPVSYLPHVRIGPPPLARIWRPFYNPGAQRFEQGLASVDLFSEDQIDLTRFVLSHQQAVALMDGDTSVLEALKQHPSKPKKTRRRKWSAEEALRQYEEETGFTKWW